MQQISHCFKEGDCYTNHQGEEDLSMENKNQRICIIGGGPAGTSMAMYLEKRSTPLITTLPFVRESSMIIFKSPPMCISKHKNPMHYNWVSTYGRSH